MLTGLPNTKTSERLQVNPRRRRVALEDRKRVVRACNSCNVRRVKCSGDQPCRHCSSASRECEYPAPEEDQRRVSQRDLHQLQQQCIALENCLKIALPDKRERERLLAQHKWQSHDLSVGRSEGVSPTRSGTEVSVVGDTEATEGRLLSDPYGTFRFLGETSGATFLDYLKHFMLTLAPLSYNDNESGTTEDGSAFVASIGQYQTWDSRPLAKPIVEPDALPSRTEMTMMLAEVRYCIQDGNGDFPCGGIYYWGDLSNVPSPISEMAHQTTIAGVNIHRHLAPYQAAFAMARLISKRPSQAPEEGEAYFQRAKILLDDLTDTMRFSMSDVSAMALMGLYLVEQNRRDAAYMYVSTAIHMSVVHGVFRECLDEPTKRVFWTLYILDRLLSCLMGRPPSLVDEAIRLPLPVDVPSLPPAAGLRAHVELSRISSYIVCNTFRVAPRTTGLSTFRQDVDEAMNMLQVWLNKLPPSLQMSSEQFSLDYACCALHMSYHQLVLLVTRSDLLAAVKKAIAERYFQKQQWVLEEDAQLGHIQASIEAAHRNVVLTRWAIGLNNSRTIFQMELHFIFNAAIILILAKILHPSPVEIVPDTVIDFAIGLFKDELKSGSNYVRDCFKVLQDSRILVDRLLRSQASLAAVVNTPISEEATRMGQADPVDMSRDEQYSDLSATRDPFNDSVTLYQTLEAWMQSEDPQIYTGFLT